MLKFITIEGIEGSGKSTLQQMLAESLQTLFPEVVLTREPGATAVGKSIRRLLLDPSITDLDPRAELFLFAADRVQHLSEVVRPALARGALVICDRYIHSTLAYQGYGHGLDLTSVMRVLEFATGGLQPDLVLLLDLNAETGLQRVSLRHSCTATTDSRETAFSANGHDRIEEQSLEFHQRVRQGFLAMAEQNGDRFAVINALQSAEEVHKAAVEAVSQRLER